MNICIIPARGGSKRIPRKNIKNFCGKPMIAHSIAAAQKADLFDRIIVSTDDEEIADVATTFGAEIPFLRPPHLADDYATTAEVIEHALKSEPHIGINFSYACCLYATAPFALPSEIRRGLSILLQTNAHSAFSVTTFPFPIQRALRINSCGRLALFHPEHELTRSNDLEEAYHDAGQFYWINVSSFIQTPRLYSENSAPIILPRHIVQDIDTPEDWDQAQTIFETLKKKKII